MPWISVRRTSHWMHKQVRGRTMSIKPLLAGNWKMNGMAESLSEIDLLIASLPAEADRVADILICPPATLLDRVAQKGAPHAIMAGGQNCHMAQGGAHTGDISALMLKDAGASHVILGHSERRSDHHETDGLVRAKAESAITAGLIPIVCVGETLAERQNGVAQTVVEHQLEGSLPPTLTTAIVIAYEPVWAIGTGKVPGLDDIAEMHGSIREWLQNKYGSLGEATPILYGGSLKPDNARDILAVENVDGGLIGGASLKAQDLLAIYAAAQ